MKTMLSEVRSPEERRLFILEGISKDLTNMEIADGMGVNKWIVIRDLRAMKYNGDPELRQAILDQEIRVLMSKRSITNEREEKFHNMTGMTFQEKSFQNMVNFYKHEIDRVLLSKDEYIAIMGLGKNIQRTLANNDIIDGRKNRRRISEKARGYLYKGR